VPVLLVLLLCALVAGIVLTLLDRRDDNRREDARQAALQAARQQAVNMTTISYETADRDLGRIIAAATGTLKTQFQAQEKSFPDVLRKEKSISVGTVLASGIASETGNKVEALVAVDAAVRNATSGSSPAVKHYRMDMTLVHHGKHWLVSDVAFAGLPQ
jgi:Mce-associated membrane protein